MYVVLKYFSHNGSQSGYYPCCLAHSMRDAVWFIHQQNGSLSTFAKYPDNDTYTIEVVPIITPEAIGG